jgi:hypothetical protein
VVSSAHDRSGSTGSADRVDWLVGLSGDVSEFAIITVGVSDRDRVYRAR